MFSTHFGSRPCGTVPVRSISQEIHAANSKLAQFLKSREDEEALLAPKRRTTRQSPQEKIRRGINKWLQEPDYSIPSSLVDRPRTSTGGTSFHFKYDAISKIVYPLDDNNSPITWCFPKSCMSPLEHALYIERDGAVETSAAVHASYIERGEAVERPSTPDSDHENAMPADPTAPPLAIVSNISDDPVAREHYWREVPDHESSPRQHDLRLNHSAPDAWWAAVVSDQSIDHALRTFANEQRVAYLNLASEEAEWISQPFRCDLRQAGEILSAMSKLPGFDHGNPPAVLEPLRAGRIQYRIVLELPNEVSAAGRYTIMTGFSNAIGSLETRVDESGATKCIGMMHTAAIHAPDSHNDSRNYHLHVVAHDRPAELVFDDQGQRWVFAKTKLDSCRKIGFVEQLRHIASEIVNGVLKAEGVERHYDPRRYSKMGIKRTPTKHLGTAAHALETAGIPTRIGSQNAILIWRDAEAELLAEIDRMRASQSRGTEMLQALYHRAWQCDSSRSDVHDLWGCIMSRQSLSDSLIEEHKALLLCELNEAKSKSRPVRTMQTCRTFLNGIEGGRAPANVVRSAALIGARFLSAKQRVQAIDEALEEHRSALADARAHAATHADILRQFDADVAKFAAAVERAAQRDNPPVPMPAELSSKLTGAWKHRAEVAVQDDAEPDRRDVMGPMESEPATPPKIGGKSIVEQGVLLIQEGEGRRQVTGSEEGQKSRPPNQEPQASEQLDASQVFGLENGRAEAESKGGEELQDRAMPASATLLAGRKYEPAPRRESGGQVPDRGQIQNGCHASHVGDDNSPNAAAQPVCDNCEVGINSATKPSRSAAGKSTAEGIERPMDATGHVADKAETLDRVRESTKPAERPPSAGTEHRSVMAAKGMHRTHAVSQADEHETALAPSSSPVPTNGTAGSSDRSRWEEIFAKIDREKLLITRSRESGFSVRGLTGAEAKLLHDPSLAARTQGRLKSRFDVQHRELVRVVKWLRIHGRKPSILSLENRTGTFLKSPPRAIRTLMERYIAHPAVVGFMRAEEARRKAVAAAARQRAAAASPRSQPRPPANVSGVNQPAQNAASGATNTATSTSQAAAISLDVLLAASRAQGRSR